MAESCRNGNKLPFNGQACWVPFPYQIGHKTMKVKLKKRRMGKHALNRLAIARAWLRIGNKYPGCALQKHAMEDIAKLERVYGTNHS